MILVDSSVWVDYFNGQTTPQVDRLDQLLCLSATLFTNRSVVSPQIWMRWFVNFA